MKKRVYDEDWGWGEIIAESTDKVLIRWDADPWYPKWYHKADH